MIAKRTNRDGSVTYTARVYRGLRRYEWVGSFRSSDYPTKRAAERAAKAAEADALRDRRQKPRLTCEAYAERFLADYERSHKVSSFDTAKTSLRRFREDFGSRRLDSIARLDAKDWAAKVPSSIVPIIVTMMNQALEDELIARNPFRGLGRRTKGRTDQAPPTEAELARLIGACSTLGKDYAPMMRALITFAAYTGLRPGELYALEWTDIDFDQMRMLITRRLYRGGLDLPKSNDSKLIVLTPPARDALLGLPRTSRYVFTTKTGKRMSQPVLSGYWAQVKAKAGLDFDFYLATKHYCVHYLWVKLDLPERVIAEQMGWSLDETGRAIRKLMKVYGHGNIGALEQIDAAFAGAKVTPLRVASETHEGA